jgi:Glucose-6-phosphate dehydrogenase, C-terminal domain
VPGYRDEDLVSLASTVETFVAVRAWVDNPHWKGVPFSLRTGKRLPRRATEVTIILCESERRLFDGTGIGRLPAHHLALRIQPDEGISMVFRAKEPGPGMTLDAVPMDFSYGASFRTRPAEAHERLLHDAMASDQTLFLCEDGVEPLLGDRDSGARHVRKRSPVCGRDLGTESMRGARLRTQAATRRRGGGRPSECEGRARRAREARPEFRGRRRSRPGHPPRAIACPGLSDIQSEPTNLCTCRGRRPQRSPLVATCTSSAAGSHGARRAPRSTTTSGREPEGRRSDAPGKAVSLQPDSRRGATPINARVTDSCVTRPFPYQTGAKEKPAICRLFA